METSPCPGCAKRDARIAELEARNAELEAKVAFLERQLTDLQRRFAELEARLKTTASNSSLPPSANPIGSAPPVKKKKSGRKRGGQPGHQAHLRQVFPETQITEVVDVYPSQCCNCQTPLSNQAGPNDPAPIKFQRAELPKIIVEVTEYRGHARTCPRCGEVMQAVIPAEIRAHAFGPRLVATLSYFSGCQGMSKRGVEETCEVVFGIPISVGTVCNLEQEVSEALAEPYRQAVEVVRASKVKYADETSWKKKGMKCWLWAAAVTDIVAAFLIHSTRGALGMASLLGETVRGYVHSDRYGTYAEVPANRRQICWAHLKRDFQKLIDRGGQDEKIGRRGRAIVRRVFAAWHEFEEGKVTRERLQAKIDVIAACMNRLLIEGADPFGDAARRDTQLVRFCENLLKVEEGLWTFARVEGMEPTNNFMERLMRLAVLWRKKSFGCDSESGCRFVERILTAVQTCRLQKRSSLEYLNQAVEAARQRKPAPKLA